MPTFELTETEPREGCRLITVAGELDLAVAGELEAALDRATDAGEILVDLSSCEFLDSTGLAVLVNTRNELRDEGRRLALLSPSRQVARLLEVTGLGEQDLVFATIEEAHAATR